MAKITTWADEVRSAAQRLRQAADRLEAAATGERIAYNLWAAWELTQAAHTSIGDVKEAHDRRDTVRDTWIDGPAR